MFYIEKISMFLNTFEQLRLIENVSSEIVLFL